VAVPPSTLSGAATPLSAAPRPLTVSPPRPFLDARADAGEILRQLFDDKKVARLITPTQMPAFWTRSGAQSALSDDAQFVVARYLLALLRRMTKRDGVPTNDALTVMRNNVPDVNTRLADALDKVQRAKPGELDTALRSDRDASIDTGAAAMPVAMRPAEATFGVGLGEVRQELAMYKARFEAEAKRARQLEADRDELQRRADQEKRALEDKLAKLELDKAGQKQALELKFADEERTLQSKLEAAKATSAADKSALELRFATEKTGLESKLAQCNAAKTSELSAATQQVANEKATSAAALAREKATSDAKVAAAETSKAVDIMRETNRLRDELDKARASARTEIDKAKTDIDKAKAEYQAARDKLERDIAAERLKLQTERNKLAEEVRAEKSAADNKVAMATLAKQQAENMSTLTKQQLDMSNARIRDLERDLRDCQRSAGRGGGAAAMSPPGPAASPTISDVAMGGASGGGAGTVLSGPPSSAVIDDRIQQLEREKQELQGRLDAELEALRQCTENSQSALAEFTRERNNFEMLLRRADDDKRTLAERITTLEDQRRTADQQLAEANLRATSATAEKLAADQQLSEMRQTRSLDRQNVERNIKEKDERIELLVSQARDAQQKVDDATAREGAAERLKVAAETRAADAEATREEALQRMATMEQQVRDAAARLTELQQELERAQAQASGTGAEASRRITELEAALETKTAESATREQTIRTCQQEKATWKAALDAATAQLAAAQQQVSALQQAAMAAEWQKAGDAARHRQTEVDLAAAQTNIRALQESIKTLTDAASDTEQFRAAVGVAVLYRLANATTAAVPPQLDDAAYRWPVIYAPNTGEAQMASRRALGGFAVAGAPALSVDDLGAIWASVFGAGSA